MLEFPWPDGPDHQRAREVAPGVLWLRMPIPTTLDHINLWALREGGTAQAPLGWSLVDTGMHTDATMDAWKALLDASGPMAGAPVRRVIVTHMHPDHVGMAGWFTRTFNARLWMTQLEYLNCRVMAGDTGRQAPEEGVEFYRRAGWSAPQLAMYRERFGRFGQMIYQMPDSYRRLKHGEVLAIGGQAWQVVVGNGHSPEHACLYCAERQLFISGDQVLAGISSNVSVYPSEPEANPIADWLASLARIRELVPDTVLVLPAHKLPFRGLHERLDALEGSVTRALDRLRQALREPKRVIDLFEVMFKRPISDPMLLGLATGETVAHLNYLIHRGEVFQNNDADGVAVYALREQAARNR